MARLILPINILVVILMLSSCDNPTNEGFFDDKLHEKRLVLVLDDMDKVTVPDQIGNLKKLEVLKIRQKAEPWTIFPPLDAWNASIDYVDPNILTESITNLKNLRVLTLSNLKLTALPENFDHLSKLDSLDISMNYLIIDDEIDKLKRLHNLKYLNIRGNRLDTLVIQRWQHQRPELTLKYSLY